jgi:RNA polymerase sigma-70 factor, ECF subfamily
MNPTPSDAQDRIDMARLLEGQDTALNHLMERHGERLFHYLIRVLQNETEAADLAQETFVRIYLNRSRFKTDRKFSTWLFTIATNLARDRLRWLSRHQQVSMEANDDNESGLGNILPTADLNPSETLELEERAATVRSAVGALPEELRLPLILAEFEQQSHAEIAEVMNCSTKAVETRIYRARQQLRLVLDRAFRAEKKS